MDFMGDNDNQDASDAAEPTTTKKEQLLVTFAALQPAMCDIVAWFDSSNVFRVPISARMASAQSVNSTMLATFGTMSGLGGTVEPTAKAQCTLRVDK